MYMGVVILLNHLVHDERSIRDVRTNCWLVLTAGAYCCWYFLLAGGDPCLVISFTYPSCHLTIPIIHIVGALSILFTKMARLK